MTWFLPNDPNVIPQPPNVQRLQVIPVKEHLNTKTDLVCFLLCVSAILYLWFTDHSSSANDQAIHQKAVCHGHGKQHATPIMVIIMIIMAIIMIIMVIIMIIMVIIMIIMVINIVIIAVMVLIIQVVTVVTMLVTMDISMIVKTLLKGIRGNRR